jgi:hypothetical protein
VDPFLGGVAREEHHHDDRRRVRRSEEAERHRHRGDDQGVEVSVDEVAVPRAGVMIHVRGVEKMVQDACPKTLAPGEWAMHQVPTGGVLDQRPQHDAHGGEGDDADEPRPTITRPRWARRVESA